MSAGQRARRWRGGLLGFLEFQQSENRKRSNHRGDSAEAEDFGAAEVPSQHDSADDRADNGADPADAERPANAGGADRCRVEYGRKRIGDVLAADDADPGSIRMSLRLCGLQQTNIYPRRSP